MSAQSNTNNLFAAVKWFGENEVADLKKNGFSFCINPESEDFHQSETKWVMVKMIHATNDTELCDIIKQMGLPNGTLGFGFFNVKYITEKTPSLKNFVDSYIKKNSN